MKEVVAYAKSWPGLAVSEVYKFAIASSGFVIKLAKAGNRRLHYTHASYARLHTERRLPKMGLIPSDWVLLVA